MAVDTVSAEIDNAPSKNLVDLPPLTKESTSHEDGVLSLEQIEQARDADYVTVPCPEWGGNIRLASINALQVEMLQKRTAKGEAVAGTMEMVVSSMVNTDGTHQVTDPEQIAIIARKLLQKEAKVIDRLLRAFMQLNNVTVLTPSLEV